LLMAARPPVPLAPEAPEGHDALFPVDGVDVVADALAAQEEAEGQVRVLGDAPRVPAADSAQARRANGAVGTAVGGELEERLAPVLVDEVARHVVDGDEARQRRVVSVPD